jgi:sugar/nucleoside kinase (ribokinase family)
MACKTLSKLCFGSSVEEVALHPVISSVIPLCKVGADDAGHKLISLLEQSGLSTGYIESHFMKAARDKDPLARTALSVLPIFQSGARGCFFDAASSQTFDANEIGEMLQEVSTAKNKSKIGAFIFGYPHLLPKIRGENLARVFFDARSLMSKNLSGGGITVLDINGVPPYSNAASHMRRGRTVEDLKSDPVLGAALSNIDILHLNEQELADITGVFLGKTENNAGLVNEADIDDAVKLFIDADVAIVAVTRGKDGCFVRCGNSKRFKRTPALPKSWADCTVMSQASELPSDAIINSNGAGDSFTAGFLVGAMLRNPYASSPKAVSSVAHRSLSPLHKKQPQKMTAYTLYMSERYVSLKTQCDEDKKEIFRRCHEQWQNETDEVRRNYEDKIAKLTSENADFITYSTDDNNNSFHQQQTLTLQQAADFASLVAAHHVNVATRNVKYLDVQLLLEKVLTIGPKEEAIEI